MGNTTISLSCKYKSCKFKSNDSDFKVITLTVQSFLAPTQDQSHPDLTNKTITAFGEVPDEILTSSSDLDILVSGTWENTKYGQQLKIINISLSFPSSQEGVIKYLSSGVVKGVGPTLANRIVERFGDDTLSVIENEPERLQEIKGISAVSAHKISSSWKSLSLNSAQIISTLCGYGLTVSGAKRVIRKMGIDAVNLIKENPYVLTEVNGIGFIKADTIARHIGVPLNSPARIQAAIVYVMENFTYTEGHCFVPFNNLVKKTMELLGLPVIEIYRQLSCNIPSLYIEKDRVYLKEIYDAERTVSSLINFFAYKKSRFFEDTNVVLRDYFLTEEQKNAVLSILQNRFSVLVGLPGTGKTTCIKYILSFLKRNGYTYTLCAPTGKASKRIFEQTGESAMTIHRLLEYKKDGSIGRNKETPIKSDYIIIDEASMVDIVLMSKLLNAIDETSSIILVGDYNQLPSVGPGNVLRDIVENSLCKVSRLTKIQRQAENSTIIRFAHSIHSGDLTLFPNDSDFCFIQESKPENIKNKIIEVFKNSDVNNTQILSPMKKGVIGTIDLNQSARYAIRGEDLKFSVGDRIIQKYNNYSKDVFNGEIGYIEEVEYNGEKVVAISARYDDRQVVYEDYELDEIDFAYALTVHKSQGSEYEQVIMPISTSHYIMLSRNLLYTAVTRAKSKLTLIGTKEALNIAIKNNKPIIRHTSLC